MRLRHNISRKYHVFHSIFEGHTTSPTAGSHHSATDIAPLEGADQPGPIDPAAFQQRGPGFAMPQQQATAYGAGLVELFTPIASGKLNINTAGAAALQLIPGVDSRAAEAIVAARAGEDD